jgi:hypothetical protein
VRNPQFKIKFFYTLFQNGPYCKLILLFTKYFRLTNYIWMFCEGFYLHRLISSAFAEERSLVLFYVIGWGKYCITSSQKLIIYFDMDGKMWYVTFITFISSYTKEGRKFVCAQISTFLRNIFTYSVTVFFYSASFLM